MESSPAEPEEADNPWQLAGRCGIPFDRPVELHAFRHGQTARNHARLISGAAETPLTDEGRGQAAALGPALDLHYACAVHSGLQRSEDTLRLALSAGEVTAPRVVVDPRLAERSMGELEGEPSRPLPAYDAGDLSWGPAGGEPYIDLVARVLSFLLDLPDYASDRNRVVLASTHVGPLRVLNGILEEVDDPVEVLTSQFPNARIRRYVVRAVPWPAFLPREPAA